MRKTYGLSIMAIHRGGETIREGSGVRDIAFQAGDTLVVYTMWDALAHLEKIMTLSLLQLNTLTKKVVLIN